MQAENLDEKKWPPRVLSGVIQRWKDRGLTPEKVSDDEAKQYSDVKLAEIYSQYQDRFLFLMQRTLEIYCCTADYFSTKP